jgi:phosphoribosyl 1,2-cyclic phosphate phosphodiesterase
VAHVDAVLVTHEHFDHVVGLDDLRPFFFQDRTPIPVLAPPRTAEALAQMFGYIFRDGTYPGVSRLELQATDGPATLASRTAPEARVEVVPVPAFHGRMPIVGWRVGPLAYLTDVSHVPDESVEVIRGVDVLVLDGLRPEPHPTHLSFDEAAALAAEVGARETWLVHLTHNVLHRDADAMLPAGVRVGYDGLHIEAEG